MAVDFCSLRIGRLNGRFVHRQDIRAAHAADDAAVPSALPSLRSRFNLSKKVGS
jgi:hypothetical protein